MKIITKRSQLSGSVNIPGSKSHTIRALFLASMAEGTSRIGAPLVAADTLSGLRTCKALGADISGEQDWIVKGCGGNLAIADDIIDVGNSGTTLYIALAVAALAQGCSVFTGDSQIRRRPVGPLIAALNDLGANVRSTRGNNMAPIIVDGPFTGGNIELDCSKTSQYLTSLLITCPLSKGDTVIKARDLVEKPYIDMTLRWLSDLGVEIHADGDTFSISGRQRIAPFDKQIPADYSSATFFMLAAAITSSEILIKGLDKDDTQGDKAVIDMFCQMGAKAKWLDEGLLFSGGELCAADLDLSDTPDALPALAVAACFAQGESRLYNVAQARLKETDRIAVMQSELSKLGASISETPDGLIIKGSKLNTGVTVDGHGDHRVIMALATAGLALDGETVVNDAEAVDVTFPAFVSLMDEIGAGIVVES